MMKSKAEEGYDLPATKPAVFSRRQVRYSCLEDRIIANSVMCPESTCWLWTGQRSKRNGGRWDGRISLRVDGRHVTRRAHRVSYTAFRGEIPEGHEIDHKCRNTLCVNPEHLEAVTPTVNKSRRQYG